MKRELRVAPQVAKLLSPAALAQLESFVSDEDNRCPLCHRNVCGSVAEAVTFGEAEIAMVALAHPECARSGSYQVPGIGPGLRRRLAGEWELRMTCGRRDRKPRALITIELIYAAFAARGETEFFTADPLVDFASLRGLKPLQGPVCQLDAARSERLEIRITEAEIVLVSEFAIDTLSPGGADLDWWGQLALADRAALVIAGRGLHLDRPDDEVIERALALHPAYAAVAPVVSPQRGGRPAARMRGLFGRAPGGRSGAGRP